MEDKIFDIITDLLRDDISKTEAIEKLLNLHSVICTTRRDNLIAKTESMEQFAKESYKEEYSRVVESDMRNIRIHINKEFINDCI